MAFDGVVVRALVSELSEKLVGGRILKIAQPEKDELLFTIKNYDQYLLLLSADAGLPLIYLASNKKEAPLNTPAFCMLLRKYLTNARITAITQPGLERIINIDIEHYDELGDLSSKRLIIEIMGKHSNIIFCDSNGRILDSIKRVPAFVSSVREVLPGRDYFIPQTTDKLNPLVTDDIEKGFCSVIPTFPGKLSKAVYSTFTGISPLLSNEIINRLAFDPDIECSALTLDMFTHISKVFDRFMDDIRANVFSPCIIYEKDKPVEFSATDITLYDSNDIEGYRKEKISSISSLLETYYSVRNAVNNIKQRSTDLRKLTSNLIERESKKYDLQLTQLKDTEKREKYKLYGELLMTYCRQVVPGEKSVILEDYYSGDKVNIALDPDLSAIDNAKKYYDKYSKLKRTFEALSKLTVETAEALSELKDIALAIDIASNEDDLNLIRKELTLGGFVKEKLSKQEKTRKGTAKNGRTVSRPLHYRIDDFDVYVGKNNIQNDELTFKLAEGGDWWFHAKGVAGSHVVLKVDGRDIPDRVFELAAGLAAYYSQNRESQKAEVDYLLRKNVKKPAGSRPGFVVYYTNYSMVATPGTAGCVLVN